MAKLSALAFVVLVAVATAVTASSAHGARTLESVERVAIPASFVASPPAAEGVVDFDILLEEAPAAAGPDVDWDDKAPVSGL
ncbi:hypothetical protein PVAP13_9NG081200 [Panicum virgatum]|uniref:Uncharacterized protein n=1 Tax=Panicum virgatum TaxID=38727 RepID=A0A8T0MF73_PANVG|nr:hypothetical protein PVAP13_9NG081200 [Panicum virgatum]